MAYTQPVLDGTALPPISDYDEQREFRGGMAEMADGSVAFDVVSTTPKKLYTLTWKLIVDADKVVIEAAYDAMMTATVTFTPPNGALATNVKRTKQQIKFVVLKTATGLRWNVSMELREA